MPAAPSQTQLPQRHYFGNFFPKNVVAFVSNRAIDFARKDERLTLTPRQKKYLLRAAGLKISELPNVKQIHGRRIVIAKKPSCFTPTPVRQKSWRTGIGVPTPQRGCRSSEKTDALVVRSWGVTAARPIKADGMLTQRQNIPLTVRTADCLSIFLFDPKRKAIGLMHAGWRGTQKNIAGRAIVLMKKQFGTKPRDVRVAFGPSIQKCCYEVGIEFKKYFPSAIAQKGTFFYLDLPLVNKRQLIKAGVKARNILDSNLCTYCNRRLFSFRREGAQAGRMISFMMLKDPK